MAAAQPPRFPVSAYALAALASSMRDTLLDAAYNADLLILKSALARLVLLLANGGSHLSPREAVEAARSDGGIWALSIAANNGQLEVCRYLVQVLRVDVDAADDEGRTPLFYAVFSQNTVVVKYLLDHGADPDKADDDMLTPLHSAAGLECEMIELLLGKGASVDPIADEIGTPLHLATKERQVGAMKTLLDHNADAGAVINSDCVSTLSLDSTMGNDDSTECLNFLLEACANRDAPDDDKDENTWKIALLKSFGSKAVQRKDYSSASAFYTKALVLDPNDATLFSNKSFCCLRMGDGEAALLDALKCRELRPDWPKGYYRHGAALMLLEDYGSTCEALLDGLKLDPENADMERALRKGYNVSFDHIVAKHLCPHHYPTLTYYDRDVQGSFGIFEDIQRHQGKMSLHLR